MNNDYFDKLIDLCKLHKKLMISPYAYSFKWCNNTCDFCYLKEFMYKNPPSIENCEQISNNIVKWLNDYLPKMPKDILITLDFIGGELFCLPDEYYDKIYKPLILKVRDLTTKYGFNYNIHTFTNLIYGQDRVDKFIELHKFCDLNSIKHGFSSSFDLEGRFANETIAEQWYNNLLQVSQPFDESVDMMAETILTKSVINNYLNDKKSTLYDIFRKLQNPDNKWDLYYRPLIPMNEKQMENVPSFEDTVNFYKKLIDNCGIYNLPKLDIFRYKELEAQNEPVSMFTDCNRLAFANPSEENDEIDKEYGIIKFYCENMGKLRTFKNKGIEYLRKDIPKNKFLCTEEYKMVNYYFDNIYGCASCKFKEQCVKSELFNCYRECLYNFYDNKCWKKEVWKYMESKGLL